MAVKMQSVLQGRKTILSCSHLFTENCSMTSVSCFNQKPSARSLFVVPFLFVIPIILKIQGKHQIWCQHIRRQTTAFPCCVEIWRIQFYERHEPYWTRISMSCWHINEQSKITTNEASHSREFRCCTVLFGEFWMVVKQ